MPGFSLDRVKRNCFLLSFLIFLVGGDIIILGVGLSRWKCGCQPNRLKPVTEG